MILVVGSTGTLGSEICRRLAAVGRPVRGLIRATSAAEKVSYLADIGVETLIGDLRDPVSLKAACEGVQAVIATVPLVDLIQPEGSPSNKSQGDILQGIFDLITAAGKAGVEHLFCQRLRQIRCLHLCCIGQGRPLKQLWSTAV